MSDGRKQFKQGLAANYGNIAQKSAIKRSLSLYMIHKKINNAPTTNIKKVYKKENVKIITVF